MIRLQGSTLPVRLEAADLKDVDGGLVDGAHDGAPRVHGVAHRAHHNSRRPRVQPCSRKRLETTNSGANLCCAILNVIDPMNECQRLPEVGSSMKTMEGLATSSTAMVNRLRCSTLRPLCPAACTSDGQCPGHQQAKSISLDVSIPCPHVPNEVHSLICLGTPSAAVRHDWH